MSDFDYSIIAEGVRDLVRELKEEHGMDTIDSGDGTHHSKGMECALPDRHVFMKVPVDELIEAAEFLADTYPSAHVDASWTPGEVAFLLLWPDGKPSDTPPKMTTSDIEDQLDDLSDNFDYGKIRENLEVAFRAGMRFAGDRAELG